MTKKNEWIKQKKRKAEKKGGGRERVNKRDREE